MVKIPSFMDNPKFFIQKISYEDILEIVTISWLR